MAAKHKARRQLRQTRVAWHNAVLFTLALILCVGVVMIIAVASRQHASPHVMTASNLSNSTIPTITIMKASNPSSASSFDITLNITNSLAIGNYGYWALGNYTQTIYGIQTGNTTYSILSTYKGTWRSIKGARNPITGQLEPTNASGTFTEVYNATLPGKLNTTLKLNGYIGTFNDGGTFADIVAPPK